MHDFISITKFVTDVSARCGDAGSEPVQRMMQSVTEMFHVLSPDQLQAGVIMAFQIDGEGGGPLVDEQPEEISGAHALHVLRGTQADVALELDPTGRIRYWLAPSALNLDGRLLYKYSGPGDESVLVGGDEIPVPPLIGHLSRFAMPYFLDLEDALENYYDHLARFSRCPILASAWRDERRLIFAPRPEHLMRDSLIDALRLSLRNYKTVEVMPEQNVNTTRPVDIKVRWGDNRQVALIEVKWLGKSIKVGGTRWGSTHREDRGPQGMQQVADYLDLFREQSPDLDARGYVVVFDGRREHLKISGEAISREDAYFYEHAALPYRQELMDRPDMGSPKRFFLEPAPEGLAS